MNNSLPPFLCIIIHDRSSSVISPHWLVLLSISAAVLSSVVTMTRGDETIRIAVSPSCYPVTRLNTGWLPAVCCLLSAACCLLPAVCCLLLRPCVSQTGTVGGCLLHKPVEPRAGLPRSRQPGLPATSRHHVLLTVQRPTSTC